MQEPLAIYFHLILVYHSDASSVIPKVKLAMLMKNRTKQKKLIRMRNNDIHI